MASGSENGVPLTTVIAQDSRVSVLREFGGTKDFGETIGRLSDSNGFAWNLHHCIYTKTCAWAQVLVLRQVPGVPLTRPGAVGLEGVVGLGVLSRSHATPVSYGPTLSGRFSNCQLGGPNRHNTGIASPVCFDRLPNHISYMVVSTIYVGGPNWTIDRTIFELWLGSL